MGCSFSRAFCTIINLRTRERERLEKREIIHQGLSVAVLLEVWGDGRGYLVLREIIRERAKKQKRKKKKKKNIRERLQAQQRRGGKKKRQRWRVVGAEMWGSFASPRAHLLVYLEIWGCLACRPSNRQIHRRGWRKDSRALVTSEGEAPRTREEEAALRGSMTRS